MTGYSLNKGYLRGAKQLDLYILTISQPELPTGHVDSAVATGTHEDARGDRPYDDIAVFAIIDEHCTYVVQ